MTSRIIRVGLLAAYLREVVETDDVLQDVWVEGEISSFTVAASGHAYFAIKDESAAIDCVMWKPARLRQSFQPRVGEQVVVHGGATIYEKNTRFQIRTDVIYPAGAGILQLQLEQLTQQLEAEGLFDPSRKRPLPAFPRRMGVVTSPTGAVWHDIQHVARRRYPLVELVLAPAIMQGAEAPASVVQALAMIYSADVDIIVIARGGGSADDLWAFNDERIARAVFASPVPIVSAIGHETDTSIVDLVADVRAPTPSAAAEMTVPDIDELGAHIEALLARSLVAVRSGIAARASETTSLQHRLALRSPQAGLEFMRVSLQAEQQRLARAALQAVQRRNTELAIANASLRALDPSALLDRGYAHVSDPDTGVVVTSAGILSPGDRIVARFADGSVHAAVDVVDHQPNIR